MSEQHFHALPAGYQLHEYQIERVLGVGGFGITYLARDTQLNAVVAIKEYLPAELALRMPGTQTVSPKAPTDHEDYTWGLERFLDEASTLAQFKHPNINRVHRFIEANGTAYMVLEYIEGETLEAKLNRQGRLSETELKRLLRELLSGLEVVHQGEYVHRDIKPANIMIQPDGSAVLLDFGAARQAIGQHSRNLTTILTPGYAPFEQYDTSADDVGPWSDLYALGMVAYRAVTGVSNGALPDAITRFRRGEHTSGFPTAMQVAKTSYSHDLLVAIDWAIRVQEQDRPQNVAAWQAKLFGKETLILPPGHTIKSTRKTGVKWALLGIILLGALVAGGWWWQQHVQHNTTKAEIKPFEPAMISIRGGTFMMGSTDGTDDERPVHRVTIPSFEIGKTEVTQAQWRSVMDQEPSLFAGCDDCPVEQVSWEDVQQYLAKLNQLTGKNYRLPGEAEWEYACRGAANNDYCGGDNVDVVGWWADNSDATTQPVGQKQANAYGMYDMSGNVWEWVQDCYNANYYNAPDNGQAWQSGMCLSRVTRGGSWHSEHPIYLRAAFRGAEDIDARRSNVGFRLARTIKPDSETILIEHLETCRRYLEAGQLVGEQGGSAYVCYSEVLDTDPDNAAALDGLLAIEQKYIELVEDALNKNDLDEAQAQIMLLEQFNPESAALSRLKRRLEDLQKRQEGQAHRQPFEPEMVHIPGGSFMMGSDDGDVDEKPVHRVTVPSFKIGKTEVTQAQWRTVMGNNPSKFSGCDDCPVERVSWDDVQAYIKKLNQKTGSRYRLPSEAEWEYACRGGRSNEGYCGSNTVGSVGWSDDNSGKQTHPVGQKQANGYGLYDMSGNVWEWTQDCWNDSYNGAPSNGRAWTSGDCSHRVSRGGSWLSKKPDYLRSAYRYGNTATRQNFRFGFRLAQDL